MGLKIGLLMLLISCGQSKFGNNRANQRVIDEDLLPLVTQFEDDFGVHIWFEVIVVDSLPHPNWIGECIINGTYRKVMVLRGYVDTLYIEQIVYHELGHCALNIGHKDDIYDIMNSEVSNKVSTNMDFYIDQMLNFYYDGTYAKF